MATSSKPIPYRRIPTPPLPSKHPSTVIDPGDKFLLIWNRFFLVSSLASLFLDPLYLYYVDIQSEDLCRRFDTGLTVSVSVLRSAADLFYLVNIVVKFKTAFFAPTSQVFGVGELVRDARQIAVRYLKGGFLVDLAAMLPVPQILVLFMIPAVTSSETNSLTNVLSFIFLIQYILRLFLIFPLNAWDMAGRDVLKTAWAGAVYNLLLYLLASHVVAALWYFLSMERQHVCWMAECKKDTGAYMPICNPSFLVCNNLERPERKFWLNSTNVGRDCDASSQHSRFKFGIFAAALANDVDKASFTEKYLYCFWWGLQQLSSTGQNLGTSTFTGETLFSILVCTLGLVLFARLIGNMQIYLQSSTVRLEEWRVKQRDTEEWMRHRQLPHDLRERVRRFIQYKWLATRGLDEESILHSLPLDLRRAIQRHQCLALVCRVPFFSQMDCPLLDAICERLFSSLWTKGSYIIREGDPVNQMLFIIRGRLESSTTDGGRSGFFNSIKMGPGDFCGEELLTWALMPNSHVNLPFSSRTVRALEEVEAFALRSEDLKFVSNQFKHLHSKKLRHTFRYHSHHWRTWGACYIQAAWRRFKKRKLRKELMRQENSRLGGLGSQESRMVFADHGNAEYATVGGVVATGDETSPLLDLTAEPPRFSVKMVGEDSFKMPKLVRPEEPNFSINGNI